MKYIKNIELFERRIVRKPTPVGDFVFDKFFDSSDAKITEDKPENYRKYYCIEIVFKLKRSFFTVEDFDLFRNFITYMDKYCYNTPKLHGIFFRFWEGNTVVILLNILPDKMEEIKQLPEYIDWWKSIQDRYEKVKSERQLKKYAKKYNL